jgi:hypothetical protein
MARTFLAKELLHILADSPRGGEFAQQIQTCTQLFPMQTPLQKAIGSSVQRTLLARFIHAHGIPATVTRGGLVLCGHPYRLLATTRLRPMHTAGSFRILTCPTVVQLAYCDEREQLHDVVFPLDPTRPACPALVPDIFLSNYVVTMDALR